MVGSSRQTYLERARATLAAREAWQSVFVPSANSQNRPPPETSEKRGQTRSPNDPSTVSDAPSTCDKSDKSDQRSAVDECEDQEVAWRVEAMRRQIRPGPIIPFLVARRDFVDTPGGCLSCGDPRGSGRRYRCGPCVRAAEIVVNEAWEGRHQVGDRQSQGG